ncbi:MAG: extracellular solute-binding protein [Neomegalonema sp.]|nr:extracellular solute-binding protein [Neomegalonema sp.]
MRHAVIALLLWGAASAAYAKELTIFTDRQERLIVFLLAAFEVESGVKPRVTYGEIEDLIDIYARDGELPYDVVLTRDVGAMAWFLARGVFKPVTSPKVLARVPEVYRDSKARWIAVSRRTRAFFVSADRVADGAIATYEDLADPKWKGRICSRALDHSYSVQLLTGVIAEYDLIYAQKWLDLIIGNLARAPLGSDANQIKMVAKGDCDIAIANSYVKGMLSYSETGRSALKKTRLVLPTFRKGGGLPMLTAVAVSAKTPSTESAEKFVGFLVSEAGQRIMMLLGFEHPVALGVSLEGQVAHWGDIKRPNYAYSRELTLRPVGAGIAAVRAQVARAISTTPR